MNVAVILAGGVGARIGAGIPKQFIEVQGKPIIAYAIERYQNNKNIDYIELVCIESHLDQINKIISTYGFTKVKWITNGGATFQASTMNGLYNLQGKIDDDDIVLVSFGVSPMTSDEIIDDAIEVCKEHGNAFPADEMIMCTCRKDTEHSSHTSILRESLVGLNTPQAFKYKEVIDAYEEGKRKGLLDKIDPHTSSLYLSLGKEIYFSKSATNNIKITRKEDLELFEGYVLLKNRNKIV